MEFMGKKNVVNVGIRNWWHNGHQLNYNDNMHVAFLNIAFGFLL